MTKQLLHEEKMQVCFTSNTSSPLPFFGVMPLFVNEVIDFMILGGKA